MSTFMIHCGGKQVNFEELSAIPLPERTDTYEPVAFADLQPTPNAIVSRNVPITVQPQLTTYSDERILTVKILMDEMNFNDLEKDIKLSNG